MTRCSRVSTSTKNTASVRRITIPRLSRNCGIFLRAPIWRSSPFDPVKAGWTKQFDVDFQNPVEQIKEFYIQGHTASVKPTGHPEGLLIETPELRYGSDEAWNSQVYIWSNKTFEGNVYVEFEWKAIKPNGLSLLMIHASGMGREDFMADYPKRTNGTDADRPRRGCAQLPLGVLPRNERRPK